VSHDPTPQLAVEAPQLDLLAGDRLPPLPAAYLRGEHRELLAPLRFLPPGELPAAAPAAIERRPLADALAVANAAYGHPAADELAARLADPETRVVVTGQQPGLFGGPLLTLTKMAAAVRWAETLTARGMPAVAVFWVATEDHDWAEVAQATFMAGDGTVERVDLGEDPAPLMPVGMRTFGAPVAAALDAAQALYPGDLAAEPWRLIRRFYRPDARFGEAFCRLLVALLGHRAPLMLDSMDAAVKRLERPLLRRLVEARAEHQELQRQADAALEARGLPLQVAPQPGVSPLFLLHRHQRRRIVWRGDDAYALRGVEQTAAPVEQLLQTIDDNPAAVSPGVLARPAIQDALLGTTLQILGPSELAYMAQVTPAYRVLGIDAPWTALRPQTLVLERKQVEHLNELGVSLDELFATPVERLLAAKLGADVVTPVRRRIDELLAGLRQPILALDPTLERPLAKTTAQVGRNLDQLASKVAAAVARRHDVWQRRLARIAVTCRPAGTLQERALSVAHLAARYGTPAAAALCDQLDLDPTRLRAVVLSS